MTERWVSTRAGQHLKGRVKTNTAPEVALRKALHAEGARFRLHRQLEKGRNPDIVLPRRGLVVFVDGCFWHGCPVHGRKTPWAGPNVRRWEDKMLRNAARDQRSSAIARQLGWTVVRVWECEIRSDPAGSARLVLGSAAPTT